MTNQLLIIWSTVTVYEFIKFINFNHIVKNNLILLKKIFRLFTFKKVSDDRREKLIFYYSKSLLLVSMKILASTLVIIIFIFIMSLLSNSFLDLVISVVGIIEVTLILIIYHFFRKKINAKL